MQDAGCRFYWSYILYSKDLDERNGDQVQLSICIITSVNHGALVPMMPVMVEDTYFDFLARLYIQGSLCYTPSVIVVVVVVVIVLVVVVWTDGHTFFYVYWEWTNPL